MERSLIGLFVLGDRENDLFVSVIDGVQVSFRLKQKNDFLSYESNRLAPDANGYESQIISFPNIMRNERNDMKIRIAILILFVLGCLFLAFPAPAMATPPESVEISVDMWVNGENSAAGTFTMNGLVTDMGNVSEIFFIAGNTSHGVKTLESAQGSITIDYQVRLTWTEFRGIAQGRFVIISGTGAYEKLHGEGETHAELDLMTGHLVATYSGKAHFD
jgi:hypothetical protein